MKVLFLQANALDESVVLAEISACLRRAGHATALTIEREERDPWLTARSHAPDLVVVQASVLARRWVLATARTAREALDAPVVLVGTFPTFLPDEALGEGVAAVVRGDAEAALVTLAERLESGPSAAGGGLGDDPIDNVVHRGTGGDLVRGALVAPAGALDDLPLPHRELYWAPYPFIRRFPWKKLLASRGCSYGCAYCYQPTLRALFGGPPGWVRRKSIDRVVAEGRALVAGGPLSHVHFGDDLFASRLDWTEELAARWPDEVGVPFSCNTVPELITERSVAALARAGCRAIGIGVESGVEARRRDVLGRRTSNEVTLEAARRIRAAGIRLVTFNLIGSPGERPEDVWETVRLNHALGTAYTRVSLAVPIPGTGFMAEHGRERHGAEPAADFRDAGGGAPRPAFAGQDERAFRNLYYLFIWATTFPRTVPLVRRLVHARLGPLGPLLNLIRVWKERTVFQVPLIDGLRYFLHVGPPDRRTHNFAGLP